MHQRNKDGLCNSETKTEYLPGGLKMLNSALEIWVFAESCDRRGIKGETRVAVQTGTGTRERSTKRCNVTSVDVEGSFNGAVTRCSRKYGEVTVWVA